MRGGIDLVDLVGHQRARLEPKGDGVTHVNFSRVDVLYIYK